MTISELIKKERTRCGMTQEELALKAGITGRTISYYENGQRDPQMITFGRVLGAMGIKIQFVRMEEEKNEN